jgi:(E)-4-hydroxy-3-methylbut-2-enyl-diphosphate synthase
MERAVSLAKSLLGSLGLSSVGYHLISCPTCGRCGMDVERMAAAVDAGLEDLERSLQSKGKSLEGAARGPGTAGIVVAVMGCNVNGPGEAKMADIGIAGGRGGRGTLFARGRPVKTIEEGRLVEELLNGVRAIVEERMGRAGEGGT